MEFSAKQARHILINGLSIGSGGGYTVGRELLRHLAQARPDWVVTVALIAGVHLHKQMGEESLPDNCRLHWAPPSAKGRLARWRYENSTMARWATRNRVDVILQLNGMVIPRMRIPTFSHFQDPWPYRPQAWAGLKDRLVAASKRFEHARALRQAAGVGWTSQYLRDLICGHHRWTPRRSEVLYNGVPEPWIRRACSGLPDWDSRAMELVTVSNVAAYKRQDLVIRALPSIVRQTGAQDLKYRIVGDVSPDERRRLTDLAKGLGVADYVMIEGRVSDQRVQEAMKSARCFVLMSVCESFGIPAIEAMSFGTPVVTSDCCAMPEVCGDAAELCPVDDVQGLADRVARLMTEPARAACLRERGVQRIQKFQWETIGRKLAAGLQEIAQAR